MIKTYSTLTTFTSLTDRYEYLKLSETVGKITFGFDRFLNQKFYKSSDWRRIRNIVINRDNGCDLGISEFPINGKILIHHMNPIRIKDIVERSQDILNPEFLISVSDRTHQAIHYGDKTLLPYIPIKRFEKDTRLW